ACLSKIILVYVWRNDTKGPSFLRSIDTEGVGCGNSSSQFDNHGECRASLIVELSRTCREHHEIPVGIDSGPTGSSHPRYFASDRSVVIADEFHRLFDGSEYPVRSGCGKRNRIRFAEVIVHLVFSGGDLVWFTSAKIRKNSHLTLGIEAIEHCFFG